MLIVRDIFEVYPDRLVEAQRLVENLQLVGPEVGVGNGRLLVDFTKEHFNWPREFGMFVVEWEFDTLDSFKERTAAAMRDDRWHRAWTALKPVVRSARREVLRSPVA
jgi:hypothetical protein